MGVWDKLNYRKKTKTLRSLDFTNREPSTVRSVGGGSARVDDELYESSPRVPRPATEAPEVTERATHQPQPDVKPDPRAQWDDVAGNWILWNAELERWEQLPPSQ